MKIRWFVSLAAVALLLALGVGAAMAQAPNVSAAGQQKVAIPFHPVNANYRTIKAQIDALAPGHGVASGGQAMAVSAPTMGPSWQGQSAMLFTPSDATGAIGPTEYINVVNVSMGVYSRSGTLLSENDQATWTGFPFAAGDGEVMYSPSDNRFYASMINFNILASTLADICKDPFTGGPFCFLIYGFSKSSAPTASPSDWCFYRSDFGGRYGGNLPDYPKLGLTADFILMGVNAFGPSPNFPYIGSDVAWVIKPPAGTITACPASLKEGVKTVLRNADGSFAGTPVPANQADNSHRGAVVANEDPGAGTSKVLSIFSVSPCRDAEGEGTVEGTKGPATFSIRHKECEGGEDHESVSDPLAGHNFQSTQVTGATFDGVTVTIVGLGTDNGLPVAFTLEVVDSTLAPPGSFGITLSDGYILSGSLRSGSVTVPDSTGGPIFGNAVTVGGPGGVAPYAMPPSAPQPPSSSGVTGLTLDTLDARLTNAVQAIDPRFGTTVVWTQHTVAASGTGFGSEVRWYEIELAGGDLFQTGIVHDPNLYCFMGAISPDRNGATHNFGRNMVLGFNTSSATDAGSPKAQMVSKKGANPQSGFVLVRTSPNSDQDFSCGPSGNPPCRWGDYSGASPDPASTTGDVWLTVMLMGNDLGTPTGPVVDPAWITWNWEATP